VQKFFQVYLMKEAVLRGYVAAAKHDPMGLSDEFRGAPAIAPVKHCYLRRIDA
jgi:hypothetical protein